MIARNQRQRAARLYVWLAVLLLAAFGLLAGYHFFFRDRHTADAALLRELQAAQLGRTPPAPAVKGEWPQWRGPNRDGISAETGLLKEWPKEGPKELWRAQGGLGYSTFAVADGRAYTILQDGDDEAVVCWDAETGKERWRFKYAARFENGFGSGPRSTPTVQDGLVYAVGATGIFHCLKADSGDKVWRHDLLEEFKADNLEWGVSFSPLIEGDLVLTNPGGPKGGSIAAFDGKDGKLVWKSLDDQAGYSSPIAASLAGTRQVLFFTGQALVSVSPTDGKENWRYPWRTSYDVNAATPIVLDDYVFISSGYGKGAALLKVEADGGGLKAKRVYETNRMCNHFSSCVLYKEHLYGFTDPGLLTCMEFRSGKVLWQQRGFETGSLTIADGHLIVLGKHGKLALVEASSEGYREKASCQPFKDKCWSVPVLANGRLYLRDEATVLCLDLRTR